jgi:hypothetical protein
MTIYLKIHEKYVFFNDHCILTCLDIPQM